MAIVKKFNPNQIYLSKKLEDRLKTIYDYPVTIVEAPTGYGKTTVVREYLKSVGKPYIWFNVDSESREKGFSDFCAKISNINETAAHKLLAIGYPYDELAVKQIVSAINIIKYLETTVFVIDNYQLIADKNLDEIVKDLSGSADKNVRIVILTQAVNSKGAFDMIMSRKINYISKADFELDREEIAQYYKLCGIKLDDDETEFLYKYTEGWISALYLQMLSYIETSTFEMTVDIENLIGKAIWYNLDRASQDFLIGISVFSNFTLRQCIYIADGSLEEKNIEELLKRSGFIKYDAKEGKYFMHSILKYFLDSEFEKMEVVFRKKILQKAGNWYRDNEMYVEAIEFYYKTKDFEAILSMDYAADVLHAIYFGRTGRELFKDITLNASVEIKKKYMRTYILYVYFLFIDNQREYYQRECECIYDIIEDEYRNKPEYNELLGEYYVLKCFEQFNNLKGMKKYLEKSYELLKKPSRILATRTSFLFSSPSPVALYHGTMTKIEEEATDFDEIMPVYYRITDGKSKGMEALFRAEMLLYRGELDDSHKLCEKALYMSSSREQIDVQLSALMCMARIAYLKGDTAMLKETMESMNRLTESINKSEVMILSDLCNGMINSNINSVEQIPAWLKNYQMIEKNTIITGLAFANIIYGKYLIMSEDYSKFLSISGQMLKVTGIYNNLICKIYILIYMAIAKNQTGNRDKAKEILLEAVACAQSDNMYIPFVENYSLLGSIIGEMEGVGESADFIKRINELSKRFIRALQSVERISNEDKRFGLTKREMEVAKLAAQRLSNKEIAERLFIAESTVKSNLKVIFNKLGINSRNDLKNYL